MFTIIFLFISTLNLIYSYTIYSILYTKINSLYINIYIYKCYDK